MISTGSPVATASRRLVSWEGLFTRQAKKDARKHASSSQALKQKGRALLILIAPDPNEQQPLYEALAGEMNEAYQRLSQHRTQSDI